jgi:hypothetical protein
MVRDSAHDKTTTGIVVTRTDPELAQRPIVRRESTEPGILTDVPWLPQLPPAAQRMAFALLTTVARTRLSRRRSPLPQLGTPIYLTSILRLGDTNLPQLDVEDRHHRYPPSTVHVTVANLDTATVDVGVALERLRSRDLPAPSLTIDGLGCSPDTLFLRCIADVRLDELRRAVLDDFGVVRPSSWTMRLSGRLAYANVVRFDGPGQWIRTSIPITSIECRELEIVRTDRYLSDAGTDVLERLPLVPAPGFDE